MSRPLHSFLIGCAFLAGLPALAADKDEKPQVKLSKEAKAILDLTNAVRAMEDLPPLKPNALLMEAAQGHAANMAKQMKLEHQLDGKRSGQRAKDAGYQAEITAENIAEAPRLNPRLAFDTWMKSKPHKANILGEDFEEIGIGLARDAKGNYYFCQVFGTPKK
jgi:uncharacterized protein YkwD